LKNKNIRIYFIERTDIESNADSTKTMPKTVGIAESLRTLKSCTANLLNSAAETGGIIK
jgi:hypothetical protein